eukprot:5286736-Pyramimonas_sp.AAC.1
MDLYAKMRAMGAPPVKRAKACAPRPSCKPEIAMGDEMQQQDSLQEIQASIARPLVEPKIEKL